jgi:hypothetical protein
MVNGREEDWGWPELLCHEARLVSLLQGRPEPGGGGV